MRSVRRAGTPVSGSTVQAWTMALRQTCCATTTIPVAALKCCTARTWSSCAEGFTERLDWASRSALDGIWVETIGRYPVDVGGLAVAHGKVWRVDRHEVEENVLPPYLQLLVQLVYDRPIERGFLLRARDVEEDQLNEDAVFGPVETEVVGVEKEVLRLVFSDGLKSILGHSQTFDHLVVHDVCDGAAVFHRLALDEVDPCEWHDGCPFQG